MTRCQPIEIVCGDSLTCVQSQAAKIRLINAITISPRSQHLGQSISSSTRTTGRSHLGLIPKDDLIRLDPRQTINRQHRHQHNRYQGHRPHLHSTVLPHCSLLMV